MAYDLADTIPLGVRVYDETGAPADPTTLVLTLGLPDGTTATPTITHTSVGVFQVSYVPTMAGRHSVTWAATGANAAGHADAFYVSAAAPLYLVSLADAKEQLNITSTASDEELRVYLEATTGVIERELGQAVIRRPFTEEHTVRGGMLVLTWTPTVALTALALVDGTFTWDVSTLHTSAAGIVTSPFGVAPYGRVTSTYIAGPSVAAANHGLAARIILQHLWTTKRGSAGSPRAGGLDAPTRVAGAGYALPNAARELLGAGMPGIA